MRPRQPGETRKQTYARDGYYDQWMAARNEIVAKCNLEGCATLWQPIAVPEAAGSQPVILDPRSGQLLRYTRHGVLKVVRRLSGTHKSRGAYVVSYWDKELGKRKTTPAHRLMFSVFHRVDPKGPVDHINGDPLDNRLSNLRSITHKQNMHNQIHKFEHLSVEDLDVWIETLTAIRRRKLN